MVVLFKKLNATYCEVCWLFSDRNDPSYRENWSNGIQDWQGLSKKITKHAIKLFMLFLNVILRLV